jgi:hypothetical protein
MWEGISNPITGERRLPLDRGKFIGHAGRLREPAPITKVETLWFAKFALAWLSSRSWRPTLRASASDCLAFRNVAPMSFDTTTSPETPDIGATALQNSAKTIAFLRN